MRNLRYLWVFSNYDNWMCTWHQRQIARQRERGYDVESFLLKPNPHKDEAYYFPKLDRMWRIGDPDLMRTYENLAEKLVDKDVLVHYSGVNLHPEFLRQLNVTKVFICGDDPESTKILSKPVAPFYDIQLVSNIAAVPMYKEWGLKNVHFWPLGSLTQEDAVSDITELQISNPSHRTIPIVFFGAFGGVSLMRAKRLSTLAHAFPQALCAGSGWPRGFIDWDEMWTNYRISQIGWNVHNSTGPINYRTYDLAAYGVMQICDNKAHLGNIYELDKEVIGFDTIDEAIELTNYFLTHVEEQRAIAVGGWKRWKQDYTPDRVWDKLTNIVDSHVSERQTLTNSTEIRLQLQNHEQHTRLKRQISQMLDGPRVIGSRLKSQIRKPIAKFARKILYPAK